MCISLIRCTREVGPDASHLGAPNHCAVGFELFEMRWKLLAQTRKGSGGTSSASLDSSHAKSRQLRLAKTNCSSLSVAQYWPKLSDFCLGCLVSFAGGLVRVSGYSAIQLRCSVFFVAMCSLPKLKVVKIRIVLCNVLLLQKV